MARSLHPGPPSSASQTPRRAAVEVRPVLRRRRHAGDRVGPHRVSRLRGGGEGSWPRALPVEIRVRGAHHPDRADRWRPTASTRSCFAEEGGGPAQRHRGEGRRASSTRRGRGCPSTTRQRPVAPAASLALVPAGTSVFADVAPGSGPHPQRQPGEGDRSVPDAPGTSAAGRVMLERHGGRRQLQRLADAARRPLPSTFITRDATLPLQALRRRSSPRPLPEGRGRSGSRQRVGVGGVVP